VPQCKDEDVLMDLRDPKPTYLASVHCNSIICTFSGKKWHRSCWQWNVLSLCSLLPVWKVFCITISSQIRVHRGKYIKR